PCKMAIASYTANTGGFLDLHDPHPALNDDLRPAPHSADSRCGAAASPGVHSHGRAAQSAAAPGRGDRAALHRARVRSRPGVDGPARGARADSLRTDVAEIGTARRALAAFAAAGTG